MKNHLYEQSTEGKVGYQTPLEYFFANFAVGTNALTDKLHFLSGIRHGKLRRIHPTSRIAKA